MASGRRPIPPWRTYTAAVLGVLALFVVCAGTGLTSWQIVAMGVVLFILAASLVVTSALRGGDRVYVAGTAEVLSASEPPTGSSHGRCELRLQINASGVNPVPVRIQQSRVPVSKWPSPGTELPIMVAADNPQRVRVLWDDVPTHTELAAEQRLSGGYQDGYFDAYGSTPAGPPVDPVQEPLDAPAAPAAAPADLAEPVTADLTDDLADLREGRGDPMHDEEYEGYEDPVPADLAGSAAPSSPPAGDATDQATGDRTSHTPDDRTSHTTADQTSHTPDDQTTRATGDRSTGDEAGYAAAGAGGVAGVAAGEAGEPGPPEPDPRDLPRPRPRPRPRAAATRSGAMAPTGAALAATATAAGAATGTALADPGVAGPQPDSTAADGTVAGGPVVTATATDPGTASRAGSGQANVDDLIPAYPSARPGSAGAIHGVGITVLVADLARSVAFYRDMLGFYEIDGGDGNAVLASGDTRLVLRVVGAVPPINRRMVHVNLEVADVQAVYTELKEKGVRFIYAPRPVNRGERLELWAAAFRDPDGHGIALTQWRTRGA